MKIKYQTYVSLIAISSLLILSSVVYATEKVDPIGACCIMGQYAPNCNQITESVCLEMEGLWLGAETDCDECYEGPGTCCFGWGIPVTCSYEYTWDECTSYEGIWLGKSTDCDDCGSDFGVCCMSMNPTGCTMATAESCAEIFGWNLFLGLDSDCRLDSCTPKCGDVDFSGYVNILDVVYLINYRYKSGLPPFVYESGNVDGILEINILDAIYLINFLYKDGPDLNCPGY